MVQGDEIVAVEGRILQPPRRAEEQQVLAVGARSAPTMSVSQVPTPSARLDARPEEKIEQLPVRVLRHLSPPVHGTPVRRTQQLWRVELKAGIPGHHRA